MPSKGFIVCLQLKVLSVGTNSVILRRPDPIYTTAFGYPYCSQLCCERFWIVICLLTQRQWQVKVRQDGQNHMQKIEHVLITCVYSKVPSSKKCTIPVYPVAQLSRRHSLCYQPVCAVHDAVCDAAGEFCRS